MCKKMLVKACLSGYDETEVCVGWIALSLSRPTSSNTSIAYNSKETWRNFDRYSFVLCISSSRSFTNVSTKYI